MESADVLEVARESVIVMLKISAPVMIAALVIGLIISLFQALTQIQEMTIAFVPKIVVIFATFLLFLPFMLSTLVAFTHQIAGRIVGIN